MELLDLTVGLAVATPPWLPLAMVGVLLVLLGFLYWSLRRNINRIDFDEEPTPAPSAPAVRSPRSPSD